jgi:hypothetical protein
MALQSQKQPIISTYPTYYIVYMYIGSLVEPEVPAAKVLRLVCRVCDDY